ncbi:MAG: oligosaccharide flippase family protein [Lachnospiraceae bacterium]|nr:oligosaccharide flippase family protein [Lachnospiraceae bacterium]
MDRKRNIAKDATILTFVRCVTMLVSIIQTMILTRTLSKTSYGTYSQAILVISFLSPFFSMGLENAINYFFNKSANIKIRKNYINTIFAISIASGLLCGLIILILRIQIGLYFDNPLIVPLTGYIAFRPCLQNLIALYQPMYIASGYVKIIAARNLFISLMQIVIVGGISYFFNNISMVLFLLLLLDVFQFICFAAIYRKMAFKISVLQADFSLAGEILKYALPMLFSLSVGTISANIDKLMVGKLMSVEEYALYSNVSKELPFSFIAGSFTAVVTPFIIKYINNKEDSKFKELWSCYLEMGYRVTWPLCFAALVFAPELIEVLYSGLYLSREGIIVFRLYTIAAMFRFTYFGIIPTAMGRTDIIMKYSVFGCLLNLVLNYPMYYIMGMPGPAFATIISMAVPSFLYFKTSTGLVKIHALDVLVPRKIINLIFKMFLSGILSKIVVLIFDGIVSNVLFSLTTGCFIICIVVFGTDYKTIKSLVKYMNKEE